MGRHSSGKPNNKPATGLVIGIFALLLIIALIIWWLARDTDSSSEATADQCDAGTIELLVATTDPGSTREQLQAFNDATVEVGNYCDINVELTDDISQAALLLTSYTDEQIESVADAADRTTVGSASQWATVNYVAVGVANAVDLAVLEDPQAVAYPVASDAMASALVAAYATEGDQQATAELLNEDVNLVLAAVPAGDPYAATQSAPLGEDESATSPNVIAIPGLYKQIRAVPLTRTDQVSSDAAAAALAFGEYFENHEVSAPEDSVTDQYLTTASAAMPLDLSRFGNASAETTTAATAEESTTAAEETTAEAATTEPAPAAEAAGQAAALGTNTLFLIDTSRNMTGGWMAVTREAVASGADAVVGAGGEVALWNYSSPITGARSVGWRANEDFSNNTSQIDYRLSVLGTGGNPQTHEAINAAASEAAAHNARIVLITSGSVDQEALNLQGVRLDVIHVGNGSAVDQAVADAAATQRTVLEPSELRAAVLAALGA